jgi:membrane protein
MKSDLSTFYTRSRVALKRFFTLLSRVLRGAFLTFKLARGSEAAAGISYYTLFSMFPLVLSFVAVGSFFVDQATVENELIKFLPTIIPVSQDFIISNIQQVFKLRGAVSALSVLGLIWASTSVFSVIIRNINAAWPAAAPHSFIRMRLWSLAIIAALALVLILSSFALTFKNLLGSLGINLDYSLISKFLVSYFYTQVIPVLIKVFVLFALYYWVPQIKVNKMGALTGAVVVTFLWQIITTIFNAYLSSGLARYEIVYGSLGKMIALLAWIYFISWIVLFGAHLTSSIDRHV